MSIYTYKTKKELAMAYSPDSNYDTAKRKLQRWMKAAPELMEELHAIGYEDRQRNLTPKELKIIFDHLGEPLSAEQYAQKQAKKRLRKEKKEEEKRLKERKKAIHSLITDYQYLMAEKEKLNK